MDLGKNIAKARKNANLTQEQLAEKLQVARQTVSMGSRHHHAYGAGTGEAG